MLAQDRAGSRLKLLQLQPTIACMRSFIRQLSTIFGVLALLACSRAFATQFLAALDESVWRSDGDGMLCHLSHSIPYFGVAVFSEDRAGRAALAIHAHRTMAFSIDKASVFSEAPPWKPASESLLNEARVHRDEALLRLGQYGAQRVVRELAAGQIVNVRIESEEPLRFGLSPVGFRAGLREHQACLRSLSSHESVPALVDPYYLLGYSAPKMAQATTPAVPWEAVSRIYFATDNAGLDLDAMQRLEVLGRLLQGRLARQHLAIAAYTDPRGSAAYNSELAKRRAEAVREYLVELGMAPERLSIELHPAASLLGAEPDTIGYAADRLVTLRLLGAGGAGTRSSAQPL